MMTTIGSSLPLQTVTIKKRVLFRTASSEAVKELLCFYDKKTTFSEEFRDALQTNNISNALAVSENLLSTFESQDTGSRTARDLADEMYFNCRYLDALLVYHTASNLYKTQTDTLSKKVLCKGVVNCVLGVLNTMKILLRHNENAHLYMENYAIPFTMDILQYVRRLESVGCVFEYRAWLYYYLGWANLQLGRTKDHDDFLLKALQEIETNFLNKNYKKLEVYFLCKKSLSLCGTKTL